MDEAQNCEISCGNIHRECDEQASWPANREEIAAAARSVGFLLVVGDVFLFVLVGSDARRFNRG